MTHRLLFLPLLLLLTFITAPPTPGAPLLRGRIIGWDGTPIAGASVYAFSEAPPGSSASTTTDRQGRYALDVPAGSYTLNIYAAGRSTSPLQRRVTVPPGAVVDFVLARLYTIRGTVRDGLGRPVAGARVSGGYEYAVTGPDGGYVVETEAGERGVYAEKEGYQRAGRPVRVPPAANADITLLPLDAEIDGRVVDQQGQPVPRAYVIIRSARAASGYEGSAFLRPDGSFSKKMGAGVYIVDAVKEERTSEGGWTVTAQADEPTTVALKSQQTVTVTLRMTLDPYTIEGAVIDRGGRPVKGIYVSAERNGVRHTVRTDQRGVYKLFVTPGAYRVYAGEPKLLAQEPRRLTPAICVTVPPSAAHIELHMCPPDGCPEECIRAIIRP